MSIQNPATHAEARQRAAHRYEAERRQLAIRLEQRLNTDTRLAVRDRDLLQKRELALRQTSHMLVPLSRYIQDEIRRWADKDVVERHLVETDDVLMATIGEAAERLSELPATTGVYPWLRSLTRKAVRRAVDETAERVETEQSLETPVRIAGEDWPDRALLLKDVLADPKSVLPDEMVERQEIRALLQQGLDQLPVRWREVFLLRSVDAWDDDEIATAEGIDVCEVEMINVAARAFLREYFLENEILDGREIV